MAVSLNGDGTITGLSTLSSVTITGLTSLTTTDLTADTTTLVVDSANNRVGIGTASPSTALQVVGTATATAFSGPLTGNVTGDVSGNAGTVTNGVYTTDIGSTVQAYDADTTKNDVANTFTANQTINADLTVDTDTLYVDSANDRVGIGTSSPSEALVVIGKTSFGSDWEDNTATSLDTYQFGSYAQAVTAIQLKSTSTGTGSITFSGDNTTRYGLIQYDHSDNFLRIYTNNAERMRIDSSGNVGIGTSSPDYKLHVANSTDSVMLLESGNTSSSVLLFGDTDSNFRGQIAYDHSTESMNFYSNGLGSIDMRIDSSGNVGIGTTSPGSKLDVSGTVTATAFSGDGSALTNLPSSGGDLRAQIFTSPGTWTKPSSVSYVKVLVIGGGGGAGGNGATSSFGSALSATGGAAGPGPKISGTGTVSSGNALKSGTYANWYTTNSSAPTSHGYNTPTNQFYQIFASYGGIAGDIRIPSAFGDGPAVTYSAANQFVAGAGAFTPGGQAGSGGIAHATNVPVSAPVSVTVGAGGPAGPGRGGASGVVVVEYIG